ncbi:glycosyltransferase family 2 protein [Methanocalculus sp. MC3]
MISVIVPTYNEESNIEECLQSLANQSIPRSEYEIIVVDGNSKDRTREIAEKYADLVFIQTRKKVGGARNDGAEASKGDIIATTDADCIIPRDWLARIEAGFSDPEVVQLYGLVEPIEPGIRHKISLALANTFSRLGYYTHTLYYTLGCNTAFRREAFFEAGMYRTIDAGDDLEIARRMRQIGRVKLDGKLRVKFSMRRYVQFGTLKSLYEWLYITIKGGDDEKYQYSKREYK